MTAVAPPAGQPPAPLAPAAAPLAPGETLMTSDVAARLDRLPWSSFHLYLVIALGVTWLLDGLEVTLAGAVAGALKASPVLHLNNTDIGLASSAYLTGAVLGALGFGWLTDRIGRRKLFFITLFLYAGATLATAASWNLASLLLFRFLTGAGIGGEYTAINSCIQEFTPARLRGHTDLAINGTFWLGAALGAGTSVVLLDPGWLAPDHGWRLCFLLGGVLALIIIVMRRWVPESPRWLLLRGRREEAEKIVADIEQELISKGYVLPDVALPKMTLRARDSTPLRDVFETLFVTFRQRSFVGLALMIAQAFFYNAIFFTYALVLIDFYQVPSEHIGWYLLPFAAGNFLGPLLLGRLFDTIGRRRMIAFTYAISGVLLAISGYMFQQQWLTATTQTIAWTVIFFFASAAASSAYLTVSESFPLEVRALAIALFYALGTALGGIAGPSIFGLLLDTNERGPVLLGYLFGAALMVVAAAVVVRWGVDAERKSLEDVARPLSRHD